MELQQNTEVSQTITEKLESKTVSLKIAMSHKRINNLQNEICNNELQ